MLALILIGAIVFVCSYIALVYSGIFDGAWTLVVALCVAGLSMIGLYRCGQGGSSEKGEGGEIGFILDLYSILPFLFILVVLLFLLDRLWSKWSARMQERLRNPFGRERKMEIEEGDSSPNVGWSYRTPSPPSIPIPDTQPSPTEDSLRRPRSGSNLKR